MSVRRTVLAGAVAMSMVAVPLAAGPAHAADDPPPVADPIGDGNVCEGAPDESPFDDISQERAATAAAIRCLVTAGITTGTTDTTYGPGASVTRRQMALFVKRLADLLDDLDVEDGVAALPPYDGVVDYPDVALEDPEVQEAIGQLDQADIVGGYEDGLFRPADPVTRRQMAAFVNRLQAHLVGEAFTDDGDYFTDDDGDPGEDNLDALAAVGIFQGEGGGRVVPGGHITRRQMANVLLRHAQVLFADGVVVAPFVAPTAPAQPSAEAQDQTVTVTYERPAANPGSTTYALEQAEVSEGPDGFCGNGDDVAPADDDFTRVEDATETEGEGDDAGTWTFTADDVEAGCYRFRVAAVALGGAATESPATTPSTLVPDASDDTAPESLDAYVTEGGGDDGVLDAGDVITIVFSEYVVLDDEPSLSLFDGDGTQAAIVHDASSATFEVNTTSVTVGDTVQMPGRVLSIVLHGDPAIGFPGVTAGVQLPAQIVGAEGIADGAGNAWAPTPLGGGGDTELEAAGS